MYRYRYPVAIDVFRRGSFFRKPWSWDSYMIFGLKNHSPFLLFGAFKGHKRNTCVFSPSLLQLLPIWYEQPFCLGARLAGQEQQPDRPWVGEEEITLCIRRWGRGPVPRGLHLPWHPFLSGMGQGRVVSYSYIAQPDIPENNWQWQHLGPEGRVISAP